MSCPVCGGILKDHAGGCARCPLGSGCGLLCCDRCGYETVAPRSVTVDFLKRLWRWTARTKDAS